jgi:Ca2+-binding EF-hand superfamily protein
MKTLLRICALSVLPTLTFAASHDLKTFIQEYDLNHDGSVSKEEFVQERERRFGLTDADHNGGLTHDEYVNEYKTRLTAEHPDPKKMDSAMKQADVRFKVLDSNKDGKISPAEFQHSGWSMFTHHDYTKDGAISSKDDVESVAKKAGAT